MRAFRARYASGRWTVSPCAPGADPVTDHQIDVYVAEGNRRITALLTHLPPMAEAWRLELEKAAFTFGRAQLGVAEAFARHAVPGEGSEFTVTAPAEAVSRWSLMQALAATGEPVAGLGLARLGARLRFLAAAAVGHVTWKIALLRDTGGGALPGADVLFAVHPEVTNRTGHVLKLLAAETPETPLILLGRPTASRSAALELLKRRGLNPAGVARPYDWLSATIAWPRWAASLGEGMAMAAAAPFDMPFREQAAQCFRRAMGLAGEVWWKRRGLTPRSVAFGHNGLSDTAPLERAMQAGGAYTTHWLHGLTAGHVYVGVSDRLLTQCGHDAVWHTRLGGYDEARARPLPKPALGCGGEGIVVLTNFTHPVHPSFAAHGPRDELALMDIVADAADALKIDRSDIVWRPHPVIHTLPGSVQDAVNGRLAALGMRPWSAADGGFERIVDFGLILSTPSGAALDALKLGRLPVIAAPHPIDPDHVLARFPLIGATAAEIAAALTASRTPGAAKLFDEAWSGIAPGAVPSYSDLTMVGVRTG